MLVLLLAVTLTLSAQTDDLIVLPRSEDSNLKFEIDKEQLTSSDDGLVVHYCTNGSIPTSLEFPSGIDLVGYVLKREVKDAHLYSATSELMTSYASNTYVILGDMKHEKVMEDAIFNFTQTKVVRFGKVNTKIYDPLYNTFYGINKDLEKPNGFFYTINEFNNLFNDKFHLKSVFEDQNLQFEENNNFAKLNKVIQKHLEDAKNVWKFSGNATTVYMRVVADLKNRTFEFCEMDTISNKSTHIEYPSKGEAYNRNVYFLNSCGKDYFTKESVCKFTHFAERGKDAEMVDLSLLRATRPIPVYLQHLKGKGTHLTTDITTFNFNTTNKTDVYAVYTVPQGIFIDKYQMLEIERRQKEIAVFMYEPMDLEAPILTGRMAHVITKNLKKVKSIETRQIPIHLRYHKARANDLFEENYIFPPPEVFFACDNCTEGRSLESVKRRGERGYKNTPYSCGISEPDQFLSPTCKPQVSKYKVPVGQLNMFEKVMQVTLGTTLVGALILIIFLIVF
ncbi:hypothetical protein EIN_047770 [Entamoeba invadens IP1]|uniref:Uncharacterized protein n=1 Tax=Entamoeba invadens IP1 TaxID=370355 RepID=A0A0A1UDE5_ENTIV|nr:hypothetical protein EIN_047770 [Entamoeba invadens IP1]ELP94474.1 hypothetical protein EIN_047770 [Entamoeba invadens IP1]|eukprot:XP_004261245.1 hypothetical protein EIN_047770 [Entamoeba invadens IP1]